MAGDTFLICSADFWLLCLPSPQTTRPEASVEGLRHVQRENRILPGMVHALL